MNVDSHPHTVIVTGAGSGIGAATARQLAAHVTVVGVDIDEGGLRSTAEAVGAGNASFVPVCADVSVATGCERAVEVASSVGHLTSVCNIAGIAAHDASVLACTEELWDRVMAVNLKSVFLMSRAAVPTLRDRGGGVIVNISSVHAFASMPDSAPYAASKAGVAALTRQMAIDLVNLGIRVVAVAPGAVDTPMSTSAAAEQGVTLDQLGFSSDPATLGRLGTAQEIAEAICWLLDDRASFVNGATLIVDGGLLARLPTAQNRGDQ